MICALGDSVVEGISIDLTATKDAFMDRLQRTLGDGYGGVLGRAWPDWRNTGFADAHQEWVTAGTTATVVATSSDVGYGQNSALQFTGSTSSKLTWTRPPGEPVAAFDIYIVDIGAASCAGSYSIDGGTTWIDYPLTTKYTSGLGILRRFRVQTDTPPTTIAIRAASAANVSKTIIVPAIPLVTYATMPFGAVTDGLTLINGGFGGIKIRDILNSRSATDAVVTNGSAVVTSATSAFVVADAGSSVYLAGVAYTISTRDSATQITLTANYAGTTGTGKRITVFQGDSVGDRLGSIVGHPGSFHPDLTILGSWLNDPNGSTLGDGDVNAFYDNLTYMVKKIKPSSDVMLLAPHEPAALGGATLQASYRAMMHTVSTEQSVAIFDIYDAMVADGITGYAAANTQGWIADGTHLSESGNQYFADKLSSMLEFS